MSISSRGTALPDDDDSNDKYHIVTMILETTHKETKETSAPPVSNPPESIDSDVHALLIAITILGAATILLVVAILILINKIKTNQKIYSDIFDKATEDSQKRALLQKKNRTRRNSLVRKKHFGRVVLPNSRINDQLPRDSCEDSDMYTEPNDHEDKPKYIEVLADIHNTCREFRHSKTSKKVNKTSAQKCTCMQYYIIECKACQFED
uniref:Uncharacterized protein LOC111123139 n=1 Tax=Crassostrea virginica TaxID=6565 RepID=A0A8B8CYN0_CRAVI|nr:uncharacterized protein LOC111123139 [Crassostrea virginica]